MANLNILLLFVLIFIIAFTAANPVGCAQKTNNYDALIPTVCTFSVAPMPLVYGTFTTLPVHKLEIITVNGNFPSPSFSGFDTYDPTTLSSNFAATLLIKCSSGGSLTLAAGCFASMSYIQQLTIQNCQISSLPANVFSELVALDHLLIEGGSIAGFHLDTFSGLTLNNLSVPNSVGGLTIQNSEISGGYLEDSLFSSLYQMKSFILDNVGLSNVTGTMISNLTSLRTFSLSNNNISVIPTGMFNDLKALTYLALAGNFWECSCDNLWYIAYVEENLIQLSEMAICSLPSTYELKRVTTYYDDVCPKPDVCDGIPGVVVGRARCITVYMIVGYCMVAIALTAAIIGLVLIIIIRHELYKVKKRLQEKKATSWNKVQEAMKKSKQNNSEKPPIGNDDMPLVAWSN